MARKYFKKQALILLASLLFFSLFNLWFMPTPLGGRLRCFTNYFLQHLIP